MKILSNKLFAIACMAIAMVATTAYAKSIFDLEYPIVELGGCADKTSCKAYCDISEHQEVCEDFAASYGVSKAKERKEERATRKELAVKDGGPGNCAANTDNPEKSCHTYCDAPEHMNECVAYGKSRGLLKGNELEEAEKVVKALASGVALPEGCTSGESCKQMCEEPKNVGIARACFAFAEKAGLLPPHVDRVQAEKVFKLIEEGKSPFKSPKDFKQCENPESDEVMEKCLKFGEENGLIPQEDLEMIKKTGGKGPGGCRGKEQCDTYCSEHQDECMQFAEKHNLIKPEDKARMEEGLTRFREGIVNAPSEVKQCLEGVIGRDNLEQMITGKQTPKRDFGDKMRTCFESAFGLPVGEGGEEREDKREGGFPGMMRTEREASGIPFMQGRPQQGGMFPPQVEECVKGKVGESALRELGTVQIDKEGALGQAISTCMRELEGPRGEGSFQDQGGERGQMMPLQFNREQGTTTRLFQQRPEEGQFDPRSLINSEFRDTQGYDPRMQGAPYGEPRSIPYGAIPQEGQKMAPLQGGIEGQTVYPPQDGTMLQYQGGMMPYDGQVPLSAPQVQSYQYPPVSPDGTVMFPQGGETFIAPTTIAEPVN